MFEYTIIDKSLENKIILITGAGAGIGKEAAITYAKLGATVILLGKTVSKLEAVYDEIIALGLAEPAIIPLDLKGATKQNYIDMAATIANQFGRLDGALLNASILGELTPFTQIHEQIFNDVMKVNVNAQYLLAQALIPTLKLAPTASLIFTSSGVGNQGRAYWGAYSISKFATEGMMQVIADEYENSTLRTNAINPGATNTGMRTSAYPAEDKDKLATAKDIMPLYVYLMSDDSIAVNGKTIKAQ
ncbi:YciK family oxidoreductase [Colwellia sp. 4_MG-2023]|jgi:NAD(P)-dependent dehydrogenase (short-subunit alcohol dehydrogenase family)|uniref:YciK family oxidoreductase n=1 Tax=unclassified Colwellia TaxID=196834 RepID=UPI001C08EB55|nr:MULTISPECIES: YciK family oxidoreductase [unclassified Colwellia]MBU2925660.1 YciK family oxidoreductase [Colwellia sp. C2M11]MDO6507492.1 YciK family oxidoreductase [Colwellia sp. 5_MG-2023]MDO6556250.1 YciK family oxidoreductase [Colwellia sp. 4_MG-2023]MDO6651114.1 YciK family oxidoreductase [Colwellia sp. 3_MG-2023]MDO6666408.1 YciK family oxidoreductase [Colwellia sp. 2_MG-2023]